jgi:23S rRNA (uracil1939-C5)-methyltransferase
MRLHQKVCFFMIKKNKRIELEITGWADKGLAKGCVNNHDVLVPFTMPGEVIQTHITKVTPRLAYGKAVAFFKESSHRTKAPCPIFGLCGGCQLQHVIYSEQLNYKKERVEKNFKEAGLIYPFFSIEGSTDPGHYRNKSQFTITRSKEDAVVIGLSAPRSQRIVDCETCAIQHPLTNHVLRIVRDYLETNPLALSHLVTRVGVYTGELMVALVSDKQVVPGIEGLIAKLKDIPELKSVYLSHNENPEWVVLGESETLLWGASIITEKIAGLTLNLSLRSFFQVNSYQIEPLWKKIVSMLAIKKTDTVWDLYSGTGSLSLYLAKFCHAVIGIESYPESIKDAQQNAKNNSIDNTLFHEGMVEDIMPKLSEACDVVLVDPPRKGLSKSVVESIVNLLPPKILYVSCSPETLTRDLKLFCETHYQIKKVSCIDMFSQTYHVETIVLLEKIKP